MNSKTKNFLYLSFLSPVLGLYLSVRNSDDRFIVFAGTLFMGIVGSVFIYIDGNDGHTHLMHVYDYYMDMSLFVFFKDLGSLLLFQPTDIANDVYKHVISYLAGGVFRIPELIHLFGGLLLGYFFTKSVLLVLENRPKEKLGILLLLFIFLFLITRSISALNSLRMWTAMWVFFYGALAYVKRGETRYLWIIGLSVLIHFSYLLYTVPLIGAIVLREKRIIVVGLFLLSFFVKLGFDQASEIVETTGLYQDKAKYTVVDQETLDRRADEQSDKGSANFYKEFGPTVYKNYSTILLAFTLILIYLKKTDMPYLDFLIASGLLILALSNLSSTSSPSVEGRGYTIASTFLVAAAIQVLFFKDYFLYSGIRSRIINMSLYTFLVSAIPYVLFQLSYTLNTVSFFILFVPLGSWLLGSGDFSIRDFLIFNF
ncbi:hypothetical protein MM213_01105 [Belliella sp. R4-6]|uniref:EpsG family protein n=1 Tax=Belliella alkalica TaxID=1730871 RepID=A0ABS9V6M4_9BACT|nr:hypothetical protein [Belliella alkalica]MCH7412064.1 hypothetical protein [Belliella alkalica]